MQTEDQIRNRLSNIRDYYNAEWVSREVATPAASDLIWVLTGEELWGEEFLDGNYELPTLMATDAQTFAMSHRPRVCNCPPSTAQGINDHCPAHQPADPLEGIGLNGGAPRW